jgi:hypothetical protein
VVKPCGAVSVTAVPNLFAPDKRRSHSAVLVVSYGTCQEGRKLACNFNGLIACSSVVSGLKLSSGFGVIRARTGAVWLADGLGEQASS